MRDKGTAGGRFAPGSGSLWRHRDFLLLWAGESTSQVGTRIDEVAIPLLAVTVLGATPWQMGLLTAAQTAGFLLIGLLAGVVLDRVRRFPIMIAADLARFALLATIPLAAWLGVLGYPLLLVVALVTGLGTVFFDVAYQSVLSSLVGRAQLVDGNGKLESTRAAAAAGGPALGGGLVQLVGAAGAVLVDTVSYLISAALLAWIRTLEAPPEPAGTSICAEIGAGLRFVWGHRLLRPIVLCTGTPNLFTGVMQAALALFLARDLAQPGPDCTWPRSLDHGPVRIQNAPFSHRNHVGRTVGPVVATRAVSGCRRNASTSKSMTPIVCARPESRSSPGADRVAPRRRTRPVSPIAQGKRAAGT